MKLYLLEHIQTDIVIIVYFTVKFNEHCRYDLQ